jgi:hypothetical protein
MAKLACLTLYMRLHNVLHLLVVHGYLDIIYFLSLGNTFYTLPFFIAHSMQ